MFMCGTFGVFLYPLLFILGIQQTTPTAACVCEAMTPVFSVAMEIFCDRANVGSRAGRAADGIRSSWLRAAGVFLAVLGSIGMTLHGVELDKQTELGQHGKSDEVLAVAPSNRLVGNLLVISSALAYAIFLRVQRRALSQGATVLSATAWGNVSGAVLLLGTGLLGGSLSLSSLGRYPREFWAGVFYAAVVTSCIGYSLEGLANSWSSAALVSTYNAVQPFLAAIMSHIMGSGRHAADLQEMIYAVLVAAGVIILRVIGRKKQQNKRHKIQTLV